MPNHNKCQNKTLLVDDETWAFIFEPALCEEPNTAESLAYLLYSISAMSLSIGSPANFGVFPEQGLATAGLWEDSVSTDSPDSS